MVMLHTLSSGMFQVTLTEDLHSIYVFALDTAYEAFHDAIQLEGHRACSDGRDP
jgi:hypothetical protein